MLSLESLVLELKVIDRGLQTGHFDISLIELIPNPTILLEDALSRFGPHIRMLNPIIFIKLILLPNGHNLLIILHNNLLQLSQLRLLMGNSFHKLI